jgi:hypothetical protein
MTEPGWSLHPQLESDTVPVGELALSRVLAVNAADYLLLIISGERRHASKQRAGLISPSHKRPP